MHDARFEFAVGVDAIKITPRNIVAEAYLRNTLGLDAEYEYSEDLTTQHFTGGYLVKKQEPKFERLQTSACYLFAGFVLGAILMYIVLS